MYREFLQICNWIDTIPNLNFMMLLGMAGLAVLVLCWVLDWLSDWLI